ncbi:MAG: 4Fe-4S ferredoxin [Verrucomicrobia bacterium]|nr:4Fe-4S ferredoxin [Verrucomicrobiota bacterium]
MAHVVNPDLVQDLKAFGARDIEACFNCGTCTAICPLSKDGVVFPRRIIRYVQTGMEHRLLCSLEPWLCYYCGECSETCPRNAQPGELMMAARRYLTAAYDWTGLGRRLYLDVRVELGAILGLAALVVALFVLLGGPMTTELTPEGGVQLNTFAPAHVIELLDWAVGGVLAVLLLSNVWRMHRWIVGGETGLKVPLGAYARGLSTLLIHFFTQKQWLGCTPGLTRITTTRWFKHFCIFAGYVTMFVLIVMFLRWFQTDAVHPVWHPQRWVGYMATGGLLYGVSNALIGRWRRREELHKHSHPSDWIFLVLLWLTTVTGILVHIFRIHGLPHATYITYVIHLAVLVPMLVIEVPFSKWAHLAYRPVAIYLQQVVQQARAAQAANPSPQPQPA